MIITIHKKWIVILKNMKNGNIIKGNNNKRNEEIVISKALVLSL
jgi:hypothetical protein